MRSSLLLRHTALVSSAVLALLACGSDVDDAAAGGAGQGGGSGGGLGASPPVYGIVDTDQDTCYGTASAMSCADPGESLHGQDAQYDGWQPSYTDNGDGTVTDDITGLMWQQDPGAKMAYAAAVAGAATFDLGGYDDWRLPTIKELYSLILFSGGDPSGYEGTDDSGLTPFIDDATFVFSYGDTGAGERLIDSQWVTSSIYEAAVMGAQECFFGVNFADGRIKCYPTDGNPGGGGYFTIYVRNTTGYGDNDLLDHDDGTVSDQATGLMWQQEDSGQGMPWEEALGHCEDLSLAGYDDWRLPNAKELQSLVDYSRSPDTTSSAAIDPLFDVSTITNEGGEADYPFFWSSSTHASFTGGGHSAAYVCFGRCLGTMNGQWMDVHGAGAQRSDPKAGDPADYPEGHGPQGDAIRIYNHVRCVRGMATEGTTGTGGTGGGGVGGGGTGGAGAGGSGAGGEMPGPAPCTEQADCELPGACPDDAALGCSCEPVPDGNACIPQCTTPADCPEPPPGITFACSGEGLCVPQ
ncbi:MAG: DUF1566 domain-containing protein [Deltaproteobacteria bacterium]|nr:DUF1566 domain-containing protein [Deltaproteobacteria bacterium]